MAVYGCGDPDEPMYYFLYLVGGVIYWMSKEWRSVNSFTEKFKHTLHVCLIATEHGLPYCQHIYRKSKLSESSRSVWITIIAHIHCICTSILQTPLIARWIIITPSLDRVYTILCCCGILSTVWYYVALLSFRPVCTLQMHAGDL